MHKIGSPESFELCEFDGVTHTSVYAGSFSNLNNVNKMLRWRVDTQASKMCYSPYNVLSLKEIASQLKNQYGGKAPIITIFSESPLHGEIYQYGNYGDDWWQTGEISGYA